MNAWWLLRQIVEAVEGQDAGATEGSDDGEAVGSGNGATVVPEQFMSRGMHQFSFFLVLPMLNYSMILYVYPYVGIYI